MSKSEVFSDWFDTEYYHILYEDRDADEARFFIKNLVDFLQLSNRSTLLDLCCGRGRHSIYLNSLKFEVIGIDLSPNNIRYAQFFQNEKLKFLIRDMRSDFRIPKKLDVIFNMFTSFGYFDDEENINVLKNARNSIFEEGIIIIDFINIKKALDRLIPFQTLEKLGILFEIERSLKDDFIVKRIKVTDGDKKFHFEERIKNIDLTKFEEYCRLSNLKIKTIFGDYLLSDFHESDSDRLILILTR